MRSAVISALALVLAICCARSQDFDNRGANTANAVRVVEEVFSKGDTSVIANLYDPEYREYTPDMPQGLQELFDFVGDRRDAGLLVPVTVKRTVAERDFVVVHAHAGKDPDVENSGNATTDLFRFGEDGKIVAHWGNRQAIPKTTKSGATMFSDLFEFSEGHVPAATQDELDANKALVAGVLAAVFTDRDVGAVDGMYNETLWSHNPALGHGTADLKTFVANITEGTTAKLWLAMAEGDMVLAVSQIKPPGANEKDDNVGESLHEMFLVVDGLVVEHWTVEQHVTPAVETVSGNNMFGGLPGGPLGGP